MFKILKRLFRRSKYAPIYPAGGYPNTADLYSKARSGEMVVSDKVAEAIGNNLKMLQRKQHTNCPNCGAPINGHKCEYCGTEL